MTEKLRECPFCGGEGKLKKKKGPGLETFNPVHYVRCQECYACTELLEDEASAIAAWNRRASEWVSVEERLPEDGEDMTPYLVHVESKYGRSVTLTAWHPDREGGWVCEGDAVPSIRVTHWRPLPAPPEP